MKCASTFRGTLEVDRARYVLGLCVLAILIPIGCDEAPDVMVSNNEGASVPAALDVQSCEAMARGEFEVPSPELRAAYDAAVGRGGIVQLENNVDAKQGAVLNYTNGHLVPFTPMGPMTVGEEFKRHIGTYQWLSPRKGVCKGMWVCVSVSMRRGKYPPL